jgi:hypothetical protein
MPITNPQAIKFANEDIRPAADALSQLYYRAKDILARWSANGQNVTALFAPFDGTLVMDKASVAPTDGRPPITTAQVNNIISRLNEFVVDYEAGGNAKLNTVTAVAVNTRAWSAGL